MFLLSVIIVNLYRFDVECILTSSFICDYLYDYFYVYDMFYHSFYSSISRLQIGADAIYDTSLSQTTKHCPIYNSIMLASCW